MSYGNGFCKLSNPFPNGPVMFTWLDIQSGIASLHGSSVGYQLPMTVLAPFMALISFIVSVISLIAWVGVLQLYRPYLQRLKVAHRTRPAFNFGVDDWGITSQQDNGSEEANDDDSQKTGIHRRFSSNYVPPASPTAPSAPGAPRHQLLHGGWPPSNVTASASAIDSFVQVGPSSAVGTTRHDLARVGEASEDPSTAPSKAH